MVAALGAKAAANAQVLRAVARAGAGAAQAVVRFSLLTTEQLLQRLIVEDGLQEMIAKLTEENDGEAKRKPKSATSEHVPYTELSHHLITIGGKQVDVHAYVITDNIGEFRDGIYSRMLDAIERNDLGFNFPMPIVLHTHLEPSGQEVVWEVLEKYHQEAKTSVDKTKAEEKNFHFSLWFMPHNLDLSKKLMELH